MTVAKVSFQLDLFQGHDYSIINYNWFLKVIFCYKSLYWNIQKVYDLVFKALVPLSTIRRGSILMILPCNGLAIISRITACRAIWTHWLIIYKS